MASTVEPAINALLSLFGAALAGSGNPDIAGMELQLGADLPDTSARTAVYVGWLGWPGDQQTMDPTAADIAPAVAGPGTGGLGGRRDREQATIHCSAQVLDGDNNALAAKTLALAARDACVAVVQANRTLRGAIQGSASIGATSLRIQQVGYGALAVAQFDVETDAFTT